MSTQCRLTSHGLEYILRSTKKSVQRPIRGNECNLVSIDTLLIPCFQCSSLADFYHYLHHYQQLLSNSLNNNHGIPHCCAKSVARHFSNFVLQPANSDHRCNTLFYTYTYFVDIEVRQPDPAVAIDDEPATKPASVSYVLGLIRERDEKEKEKGHGSSFVNHECSVCIDEIDKPSNALSLSCLHTFHEKCLVRWLETSHVCPLCRFKLPTES